MNKPTTTNHEAQLLLKAKLLSLQEEYQDIEQKIAVFEHQIRSALSNEIIEVQELTVTYKNLKKAKKLKRLAQKKKGKNYKESSSLIPQKSHHIEVDSTLQKEKKQLYREAMLFVHPDKFSTNEDHQDLANDLTIKLVEIYQKGTLAELKEFHTHIISGNAIHIHTNDFPKDTSQNQPTDTFIQTEIEKMKVALSEIKNRHLYKVITEYKNPLSFIDELKAYYDDKILKLKKRTRKR